ncbi:MAG: hypothetical protein ISR58_00545 [Anaerolineales bacterium]|nr:hypothetical protein [Chloroflexota bacterium]MBL6979652.1 hypothetical protein [Anaerolineales bacterium]
MQKRYLPLLFILVFLLAACGGEIPTQVIEDAAQEAVAAPEATHTQLPPTETPVQVTEEVVIEEPEPVELVSECTLVSSPMSPESQYAELFAVTDDDWVSGPDDAALTIVEYGDYQ